MSKRTSPSSIPHLTNFSGRHYDDCVSDEALAQLKFTLPTSPWPPLTRRFYRYSGVDKSPIARYILTPYWNYIVTFCPQWLAPNLITLLGFVAILANIVSIAVLVPDFVGPGPTWMYWSFVVGLWIYSTLDNIDGKQARRTGFPARFEKGEAD